STAASSTSSRKAAVACRSHGFSGRMPPGLVLGGVDALKRLIEGVDVAELFGAVFVVATHQLTGDQVVDDVDPILCGMNAPRSPNIARQWAELVDRAIAHPLNKLLCRDVARCILGNLQVFMNGEVERPERKKVGVRFVTRILTNDGLQCAFKVHNRD